MDGTLAILSAVFFSGIVSLLLELSLLREFVYVFGSTATSNALIISVFLVGLAIGSYVGTWRHLMVSPQQARDRFWGLQIICILYIVLFYATKRYFVYRCTYPQVVTLYFLTTVFLPAFLSGIGYAFIVRILHERGERLITWVYGLSTLGSVIGGIAHGILLVPLWGMKSAYISAVFFAGLAAFFIGTERFSRKAMSVLIALLAIATIAGDPFEKIWATSGLLFSKDSQFGIVEVWQLTEEEARKQHDTISFGTGAYSMTEAPIDIRINNVHQAYNLPVDRRIHEQWALTSLTIAGRQAKVLLMGYASGVTAEAYLRSPLLERLDVVENCDPVIEAGQRFFPTEYVKVTTDPRTRMIVDDFRGFARFTRERYDVIALDHSLQDPYQIGFFTTEFFGRLKEILNDGGVVLLLGGGLSWNTTRLSFRYIYKNVAQGIEPHIQHHCLYLTDQPFRPEVVADYRLVTDRLIPGGVVYSDEKVWRVAGAANQ